MGFINQLITGGPHIVDLYGIPDCGQEFYKRAAEMFELADHSESNFSKPQNPALPP